METKLILTEKDIKRAIEEYIGKGDLATLTALTNLLPTLSCRHVVQQASKQLEDASDRLQTKE